MTVNTADSVTAFGNWVAADFWKHAADLDRYTRLIDDTRPQVIIETGTNTGTSAHWFSLHDSVELVITIDIDGNRWRTRNERRSWYGDVERVIGDAADPTTVDKILHRLINRRVMVSLDSDHSAGHVAAEIGLYAPLVSPGCPLVIEDGIIAHLPEQTKLAHGCQIYTGTVLEAIDQQAALLHDLGFTPDWEIEHLSTVTMHPRGWWRRTGL